MVQQSFSQATSEKPWRQEQFGQNLVLRSYCQEANDVAIGIYNGHLPTRVEFFVYALSQRCV